MVDWYAYRYGYHGVVWFPFCLLVEAKLGGRLRRLDIADYQNTGLWVGKENEHFIHPAGHTHLNAT